MSDDEHAATCRNCGNPIIHRPYFTDGRQPNPPIWWHPSNGLGTQTCSQKPSGWRGSSWPKAQPLYDDAFNQRAARDLETALDAACHEQAEQRGRFAPDAPPPATGGTAYWTDGVRP